MKPASTQKLLNNLNRQHLRTHRRYEELFWRSYMGDHSVDVEKDAALTARDRFQSNRQLRDDVAQAIAIAKGADKKRLQTWLKFFDLHQIPSELQPLKTKINELETVMHQQQTGRREGYIDPKTKKFVSTSRLKMRGMVRTEADESIRKACFEALEDLASESLAEYIQYVGLLNQYAQGLGFEDFYSYKIQTEEGMSKAELFTLFDALYHKTKFAFADIRRLEKRQRGLRQPWNYSYMLAGDFTQEEDQYFPFEQALERWGRSFAALGVDYRGGTLQLDLLDRPGKYSNGFCHWPRLVEYRDGERIPGTSNFTCTVVPGQSGSAVQGYLTLFHEGGHAAHLLNTEQIDSCLNHEYPPMSTAWAETQSMFMDTIMGSYEWKSRYALNDQGVAYPLDLARRKLERLSLLRPLSLHGIMFVCDFERQIFEAKKLTPEKIKTIARQMHRKYFDQATDSLLALTVPHIYSWSSACSYHGYGLAELALEQWREYFYKKYGYIVDNPQIGKEMAKVWKLGASKTFKEFVVLATGKKLSTSPWLRTVTKSVGATLKNLQQRAQRLEQVPHSHQAINLNARIKMVSGAQVIADNRQSFEVMARQYAGWLRKQGS